MSRHEAESEFHQELTALLARLRPELVAICSGHCLTPKQTEDVIYENAFELARQWQALNPDERSGRLLGTVETHCRRLTERQAAHSLEN
jgi:hypothetical protein